MEKPRKVFINSKWALFCQRVKQRDGHVCLRCGRGEPEVVLQVHHEIYREGKPPWDYALSDCRTLCKGCHAREHGLLEPDHGWRLIAIEDLNGPYGVCERRGCGHEIRYAHYAYHPACGYKILGSTCIEHLTREDQLLSSRVLKSYKNISKFVHESRWSNGRSKSGKAYLFSHYQHHEIRLYGEAPRFSFQLVLKEKGVRWHDYGKFVMLNNKTLVQVKELAYVALKGTLACDEEEKEFYRDIYRRLR